MPGRAVVGAQISNELWRQDICLLQKEVGDIGTKSNSWSGTLLAAGIVGLVQVVLSALIAIKRKTNYFSDYWGALGSITFGVLAYLATIMGFATFALGGDMGVSTFIITLSIIPGMIFDIMFCKYKANKHEWIGIVFAVLAGWSILGFPGLNNGLELSTWMILSFCTAFIVAVNQLITQKVKEVDPMFKNFWGGLPAVVGTIVLLFIIDEGSRLFDFSIENISIWQVSIPIGVVVTVMWSYNLLSYKTGASIALKKVVVNATYLSTTMFYGILFLKEEFTNYKVLAIVLYVVSIILMDKKAYSYVTGSLRKIDWNFLTGGRI